jgi:Uma2 family endonuclease
MSAPVEAGWVASTQHALERRKSMRLRYVNGAFLVVPVRAAHFRNAHTLLDWADAIPGFEGNGEFQLKPPINGYAPEPDFGLIRASSFDDGRAEFLHSEVVFVAEIVSTESEQRDYVTKHNHYAMASVPAYLVVDVLTAEWTLFTEPRDGSYTLTSTGNFGSLIPVEIEGKPYPIDSGKFRHL